MTLKTSEPEHLRVLAEMELELYVLTLTFELEARDASSRISEFFRGHCLGCLGRDILPRQYRALSLIPGSPLAYPMSPIVKFPGG